MFPVKITYSFHNLCVFAILRNKSKRLLNHIPDGTIHVSSESQGNKRSNKLCTMKSISVMTYTGRHSGILCSLFRILRENQPPGIDKYLPSNLFSQGLTVYFFTSGTGSGNTFFKIKVCCMLSTYSFSSPPVESDSLPGIVQPCLPYFFSCKRCFMIQKCPDKKKGTVHIIISGKVFIILYITGYFTIDLFNTVITPYRRLHRGTKTDSNAFAEYSAVYFFQIQFFVHGIFPHNRKLSAIILKFP